MHKLLYPRISPPLNYFYEGMLRKKFLDTSSRYYKSECKNNRRFCYNNWRHFGEHVERNWLSIRRSPCNKRSTCWSVLMCCKITSWAELHFEKKNCCMPRSFLVINVCNQGKNLCSPCICYPVIWITTCFGLWCWLSSGHLYVYKITRRRNQF